MELNPSTIRRKTFDLVRRGFDPQAVGAFLETIAEQIAALEEEARASRREVVTLTAELEEARSAEEAVRLTMVAATQAKEEILTSARREADELLQSARVEAEKLTAGARREAEQLAAKAHDEASSMLAEARRDAMRLLETSRHEAEEAVRLSREERDRLAVEAKMLQEGILVARRSLASLAELADAHLDESMAALTDAAPAGAAMASSLQVAATAPVDHADDALDAARQEVDSLLDGHRASADGVHEEEAASEDADSDIAPVVQLPDAVDRLLEELRNDGS